MYRVDLNLQAKFKFMHLKKKVSMSLNHPLRDSQWNFHVSFEWMDHPGLPQTSLIHPHWVWNVQNETRDEENSGWLELTSLTSPKPLGGQPGEWHSVWITCREIMSTTFNIANCYLCYRRHVIIHHNSSRQWLFARFTALLFYNGCTIESGVWSS